MMIDSITTLTDIVCKAGFNVSKNDEIMLAVYHKDNDLGIVATDGVRCYILSKEGEILNIHVQGHETRAIIFKYDHFKAESYSEITEPEKYNPETHTSMVMVTPEEFDSLVEGARKHLTPMVYKPPVVIVDSVKS